MSLTIMDISPYSRDVHSRKFGLRELIGQFRWTKEKNHIHVAEAHFSVISHNMGLLPGVLYHASPNRDAAIAELTTQLRSENCDMVCLSEIWVNKEKELIRRRLKDIYPYYKQGPDEPDADMNGGLLLLSKFPILKSSDIIYRDCYAEDCFSNKGALYVKVQPTDSVVPWNVFFTHTQNDSPTLPTVERLVAPTLVGSEAGARKALYAQLTRLGEFVQTYSAAPMSVDDSANPTLIFGDFNIQARYKERYDQMILRLGKPAVIDIWAVKHPHDDGLTTGGERVDYILLRSGFSFIPFPEQVDVLKWIAADAKPISDHFGLQLRFKKGLYITRELGS
jgi:endonuclease/exonuclease/phosphatase family metal-dependent hydrolase